MLLYHKSRFFPFKWSIWNLQVSSWKASLLQFHKKKRTQPISQAINSNDSPAAQTAGIIKQTNQRWVDFSFWQVIGTIKVRTGVLIWTDINVRFLVLKLFFYFAKSLLSDPAGSRKTEVEQRVCEFAELWDCQYSEIEFSVFPQAKWCHIWLRWLRWSVELVNMYLCAVSCSFILIMQCFFSSFYIYILNFQLCCFLSLWLSSSFSIWRGCR